MRNRVLTMVAAGALLLVAAPAATQAQWVWVGGGLSVPTSDYGDATNAGWLGTVGVGFPIGESGLGVSAEGFYGQNGATDEAEAGGLDKGSIFGAMGNVGYRIGDPENIGAYLFGGLGLLASKASFTDDTESDTESAFGYQFGVGVDVPVGSNVGVWVEGRYMGSSKDDVTTSIFGILAGLGFGIG